MQTSDQKSTETNRAYATERIGFCCGRHCPIDKSSVRYRTAMSVFILLRRVDISLDRAYQSPGNYPFATASSGQQKGERGNGRFGNCDMVAQKREEALLGSALARGLSSHAGHGANISQGVPLRRTNRTCPWLRLVPGTDDPALWRHSERQLCLDRQRPVTSAILVRADI